ncbi:MAG: hypothetical protein A4E28_00528 [Methanocella sp. PtaU1.Bin125]|nr:MAG: hypothetical protein A4E28_00528 [Methanocella sp. PtaU1.Bin125]
MMKIVIAIAAVAALTVVATAAVLAIGMSDVMSSTATESELLMPAGNVAGQALVVYTPGLTGEAKNKAAQVAGDLKAKGYEVTLAGVKSEAAGDYAGCEVIVVGAPVYLIGHGAIQTYLQALDPPEGARVGIFATGSRNPDPFPDTAWLDATVQLPAGEDHDRLLAGFVAGLLGQAET